MSDIITSENDPNNPFDITFVVEDGKEFQAHRNVLSQASPFFEKLLNADMKENNEGVIRLEWITEPLMADILQFIYTGNVQITTQENAEKLITTADYLLLSNLKTIAGKFFEQHMTIANCISIYYSIAEQYSCEALIASTRKFINSNFTTVAASDDFQNLSSHEVEKWISSDEIVIDAEENVHEIMLRWINHDKSERSVKFGELFRHVRLTTISRDFLLSDVVTNDLVKENKDCLDSVTDALNWIERSTDSEVTRPHSPRNSLKTSVMVMTDAFGEWHTCFYLPGTDEYYRLPAPEVRQSGMKQIVSHHGKLFAVTWDIAISQCYDPDLNRWSPAPWTVNANEEVISCTDNFYNGFVQHVMFVRNKICFIVNVKMGQTYMLLTYNLDSNSMAPALFHWVQEKVDFCAVAVDKFIYVVGGAEMPGRRNALSECARFDTEENEWQAKAPLAEARRLPLGVNKNENIFIAGGEAVPGRLMLLKTCEVYNILTDEWQFIASLTATRYWGNIFLLDEKLCVLGGFTRKPGKNYAEHSDEVEWYDHEKDEWNNKAIDPIRKISIEENKCPKYFLTGCSFQIFKDVLNNLEPLNSEK